LNLLLDTHVVLWWLDQSDRLSAATLDRLIDPMNRVMVSAAAIWEAVIKAGLGKLTLPPSFLDELARDRIEVLDITARHALAVAELPAIHQDPFDRIQIAQARVEGLTLVTRDAQVMRYGIDVLPA